MDMQVGLQYYKELNELVRDSQDTEITLRDLNGQRYVACASQGKHFSLYGTPGNGLGQYLNGSKIEVFGNAQDATGDTMNDGDIFIHGNCGDACGYAMRGGRILVKGNVGYRAGIHMKSYQDKKPTLIVGGQGGSFLGEYQAGGLIVVLGEGANGAYPCGFFCGTGMHGGKIILRSDNAPSGLPKQVLIREADTADIAEMQPHVEEFCKAFGGNAAEILSRKYYVLTSNPEAGYKQLYTYE